MLIKFTCVFYHIQNYCIFLTGKDIALLNFVNQTKKGHVCKLVAVSNLII